MDGIHTEQADLVNPEIDSRPSLLAFYVGNFLRESQVNLDSKFVHFAAAENGT